jgi:hypothetical protein
LWFPCISNDCNFHLIHTIISIAKLVMGPGVINTIPVISISNQAMKT